MSPRKQRAFVKSSATNTAAAISRGEVERLLRRYGATGFSVSQEYGRGRITISFVVPDSPDSGAHPVPVQLPVDIRAVYVAMYGEARDGTYDPARMAQAERVAWRQLVLWIDAALSAAQLKLQTITEAFFAHAVVATEHGSHRMIEVVEAHQAQLGAGVRRLLSAPAVTE